MLKFRDPFQIKQAKNKIPIVVDNPREVIDPHIKTKVVDLKELRIGGVSGAGFLRNDSTGFVTGGHSSSTSAHASTHVIGGNDLVDHDNLTNFVANKHIDHSTVFISGAGLLANQGGNITASRTLTLNNSDIDHTGISNIGTNTHVQLDAHLTSGAIHVPITNTSGQIVVGQGTGNAGQWQTMLTTQGDVLHHNGSNMTRLATSTSGQVLVAQGAGANIKWQVLSHTNLGDIGSNTHSQIDSHISDSSDPHGATLTQTKMDATNASWSNWCSGANLDLTGLISLNSSSGTSGQVLLSQGSADPAWGTGGAGKLELISHKTETQTQASTTFSSISGYKWLLLVGQMGTSAGTSRTITLNCNSDFTAAYEYTTIAGTTVTNSSGQSNIILANGSGDVPTAFKVFIPVDINGTSQRKMIVGHGNGYTGSAKLHGWGLWSGTGAITSLTISGAATDTLSGAVTLYGIKET